MTIPEGHFQLYDHILPALKAGDYRFDASQELEATAENGPLHKDDLPVERTSTYVTVTAPRFQLPPDQALSTFPPAGSEGAYGARLPQVVIKRRTLPWERGLVMPPGERGGTPTALPDSTPWLALVLIAEGEAKLELNKDAADCVSPGVDLDGPLDVQKANCLVVRKSVVESIFPSQKDVPLLAHAREVDIHDTELMMGDDDGFLSVVIANRLPVAGVGSDGEPAPVKYMACLINLEGQFQVLIKESKRRRDILDGLAIIDRAPVEAAVFDHVSSGGLAEHWADPLVNPVTNIDALGHVALGPHAEGIGGGGPAARALGSGPAGLQSITATGDGVAAWETSHGHAVSAVHDVYATMASDFNAVRYLTLEPEYRFPVLLHWSFVTTGNETFETIMHGLDSQLLGSLPEPRSHHGRPAPTQEEIENPAGRPKLEFVETGHVGLVQRTRRGDTMRAWYRGPLLPHPSSGERLPLAHAADQLRSVVPDGREDLSLAAAFEIGRLLALSRPAMVASLLRWRQTHFQAARQRSIWDQLIAELPFSLGEMFDPRRELERHLQVLVATKPDDLIGPPRELFTPGDPMDWGSHPLDAMSKGFGLGMELSQVLRAVDDLGDARALIADVSPAVVAAGSWQKTLGANEVSAGLQQVLNVHTAQLMSNVIANELAVDPTLGATVLRTTDVATVLQPGGGRGGILDLPGGLLAPGITGPMVGLGNIAGIGVLGPHDEPHDEPPAAPPRRRRPAKAAPRATATVPATPDPIDELLARGGRRSGKDRS